MIRELNDFESSGFSHEAVCNLTVTTMNTAGNSVQAMLHSIFGQIERLNKKKVARATAIAGCYIVNGCV